MAAAKNKFLTKRYIGFFLATVRTTAASSVS